MNHRQFQLLLLATFVSTLASCAAVPPAIPAALPQPTSTTQVGDTTVVAVSPAAAPCCKQTLPEFLGITGLFKLAGQGFGRLRSRLATRFPGLEPGPPVLPLTDPANSGADQPPAVQAAAAVKAEEGAAPQKVKAIRYLAGVGCGGCYPDVEKSFLAALDDCTEVVRYEAVKALRSTAGNPCQFCRGDACCSPNVLKKLNSVANDKTDSGCYKEPSDRVRRLARLAMTACGGTVPVEATAPQEGPSEEVEPAPPEGPAGVATMQAPQTSSAVPTLASTGNLPTRLPQDPGAPATIAAWVNGEPIYWNEILECVKAEPAALSSTGTMPTKATEDPLRARLYLAIDHRLLSQEARRRMPPDEIQRVVYAAEQRQGSGDVAGGMPVVTNAIVHDELLADQWVKHSVCAASTIPRQEIYDYFRTNFERYREPASVRWEQLSARFSRFGSREQADRTLAYVRAKTLGGDPIWPSGMNLAAIETSNRESASAAGLPEGAIGRALSTLAVGQISPIVEDAGGLHLVRVLQRTAPRNRPLDEVIDVVRSDMQQQRRSQLVEQRLQQLRGEAAIWIAPLQQASFASQVGTPPPPGLAPSEPTLAPGSLTQVQMTSGSLPSGQTAPGQPQDQSVLQPAGLAPTTSRLVVFPPRACNCP